MDTQLLKYIKAISKLRRDYKLGGAPHKPILLLAVFSLIKKGIINSNKIYITPELVLEFKELWMVLVNTPHLPNFSLPFYHMKSEPFWTLVSKQDAVIPLTSSYSIRSFKALRESIEFALLNEEFFKLLMDPVSNHFFTNHVLSTYFNESNYRELQANYSIGEQLKLEILNENTNTYAAKMQELLHTLNKEEFQEEVFIRGGVFKRLVPKLYNYACSISGMRIESVNNIQMVDACHIVPFSVSHDDTIGNGICLCPTLHRAFDRGLISLTLNYEVIVSEKLIENESLYQLSIFKGRKISLPEHLKYYPAEHNILHHQHTVFLNY